MGTNRWHESTFYEVLEIDPLAPAREVHEAYARAKATYSPDSPALYTMFTAEEARELLKIIEDAFSVLSNQRKRHEYNLSLAQQGHPAFAGLANSATASSYNPAAAGEVKSPIHAVAAPARAREELPEGFARGRFGIYEIDQKLEKEIQSVESCDGTFIQKIRLYKKVSFEQLSEATRISKSLLAAIESDAREALPAPVFVRGFVLQIARTLGVPDRLADAYMKNFRNQVGS